MEFGKLMNCKRDDVVVLANTVNGFLWRVLKVRDRRQQPLLPQSVQAKPELFRSTCYAVLQNNVNGHIRTVYHAEHVPCMVVASLS